MAAYDLQPITPQTKMIFDAEGNLVGFQNPRATGSDLIPSNDGSFTVASQATAEAGLDNVEGITSLRAKQAITAQATAVPLTGITFPSFSDVTASDTIRSAIAKLQAKFNNLSVYVRAITMSGIDLVTRAKVAAGSTVLQAIGYLQAQIDAPWGAFTTIASSTTPAIGAAATPSIYITGTTTITGFDNAPIIGAQRLVRFAGALTLTHSASLILLGGTDRTTAAGDQSLFVYESTGVWREINATIAAQVPGTGSGSFNVATQAEAEGASNNTNGLTPLRGRQMLDANFAASATLSNFLSGYAQAAVDRLAGIVNTFLKADGNTYVTPRALHLSTPGIPVTMPASTFGATPSVANNGGFLQLTGAGIHGFGTSGTHPSGAIDRYILITTSSGVPSGLYKIRSLDSTSALTLQVSYTATTVTGVARVGTGEVVVLVPTIPAGFMQPEAELDIKLKLRMSNTANNKTLKLYAGCAQTLGASGFVTEGTAIPVVSGGPMVTGGGDLWGGATVYASVEMQPINATLWNDAGTIQTDPVVGSARVSGQAVTITSDWKLALTCTFATANEYLLIEFVKITLVTKA